MMLQLISDKVLGINVSELESITEGANKEPAHIIAKNIRKAYRENRNVYFEYSTTHKDGTSTYSICYAEKGSDNRLYVNVIKIDEENIFEARDGFTNYVINSTMNNLSVGVYMRHIAEDGSKKYILFNDVAKEFYESENIQHSSHWNQADEDIADAKTMQLNDPMKIEKILRDDSGNIKRWLIISKKKINSHSGGFYIVTTAIDITKRRKNEILLEQQFSLLDSMYEHLPVGIEIYNKNGNLISINKKQIDMFGIVDKDKLIGLNLFDYPNTPEEIKSKIRAGENIECEIDYDFDLAAKYLQTRFHGHRTFAIKFVIIKNKKQELDGYLQICEDITEKKNIEKNLFQKHQLLEKIYDTLPVGIELYDSKGNLIEINNYELQLLGVSDKSSISELNLFNEPNISDDIKAQIHLGKDVEYTHEYNFDLIRNTYYKTNHNGKKFFSVNCSTLRDANNNV